jgi:actin-related protein 5
MAAKPANGSAEASRQASPKPPPTIWSLNEPPFEGYQAPQLDGWKKSTSETAIVIDNGMLQDVTTLFTK